ncbi:MAG: type II toxin-antitoxin system RelE/ParE family toxin [Bacteroidetes bacterium]|nr:type II toxin-antitoxin system RelE/ParE family toxin [Bacteroidota bacterium]
MRIVVKKSFDRDIEKVKNKDLRIALDEKLGQIEKAKSVDNVTGLKLLRGYTHHYRILVKTEDMSYRIGAVIRKETIWLVRFLPRKIVYKKFP